MIKISKRLESLAKFVESDDKVIDVGCDHAYLDIYLVQSGLSNKVYICDVNANALQNGIDNVEKYELSSNIVPIHGYGIEKAVYCDVDTLIISGMGAKNMIEIMSSPYLNRFYKVILQSNNNHDELRKFLAEKGFSIVYEEIVEDAKKSYINIVAINANRPIEYTETECEFGPMLIKDKNNLPYFKDLLESYNDIIIYSKDDELREKIKRLEGVITSLESK